MSFLDSSANCLSLVDLNDDCIINLCRYFDAESIVTVTQTCSRLKYMTECYLHYKKSYACYFDSLESKVVAVRTLRKIGKHLTKIDLMVDSQYQVSLTEFFTLLAQSVGPNLIELSILGDICVMPLEILAPILANLEVLTLQNSCCQNCVSRINLPLLCPSLRNLIICGPIIFAPTARKSFRQLESLDVTFSSEQVEVLRRNQQLTILSLRNRCTTNIVNLTAFNGILINLVKLHLDVGLIKNPIEQLPSLSNFPVLHSLELYSIPAAAFDEILKILETLSLLREIVLQCHLTRIDSRFSAIQESLPSMAAKLHRLSSFVTVNIDWTAESVTEFVRFAENLNYLDFWSGSDTNYIITPEFIRKLAAIRSSSVNGCMRPLHLKLYTKHVNVKEVFNESDVESVIRLAR